MERPLRLPCHPEGELTFVTSNPSGTSSLTSVVGRPTPPAPPRRTPPWVPDGTSCGEISTWAQAAPAAASVRNVLKAMILKPSGSHSVISFRLKHRFRGQGEGDGQVAVPSGSLQ